MKKTMIYIILLLFTIFFFGCSQDLIINGPSEVKVDEIITLSHNYSSDTEAIWTSSDENIAIVDNGNVFGISPGKVIINLKINNKEASKEITVKYPIINISIEGVNTIVSGRTTILKSNIPDQYDGLYESKWSSSDETIAMIDENGKVTTLKPGEVTIIFEYFGNKVEHIIQVLLPDVKSILIEGKTGLEVGESQQLNIKTLPEYSSGSYEFSSSDENVLITNQNGLITAINPGKAIITVSLIDNKKISSSFEITVYQKAPDKIELTGTQEINAGEYTIIKPLLSGDNASNELIWEIEDPSIAYVYKGIVLGLKEGKTKVIAKSFVDKNVFDELEITVKSVNNYIYSEEDIKKANEILSKMTLKQKVGQMFTIGFNGTSFSSTLSNVINDYNFGNVIYMGANVTNPNTLSKLSNDIQNEMIKANGVPAFISIDQEGGRVARIKVGGTHFISNMAVGATNNFENSKLIGEAMGLELKHYGINTDFAPVLDVNNNPLNPIIGVRSYYDNPLMVSLFGKNMIEGLRNSSVMACSKHFPGHGNTSTDSHYGLPIIESSLDELYQNELIPFITSINNGIDCIMTTHIIFKSIDEQYPATLSSKVLQGLLREDLNYQGLIITDGMEMQAITKHYGSYATAAVQAVKAGVDILLYTSNTNPKSAHDAIVNAVQKNEISIERINESVKRILLTKIKYGLLDNYQAKENSITELLNKNNDLNIEISKQSITLVKGEFNGLDKSKSTLIISPTTSNNLNSNIEFNSFACYASNYLKQKGHNKCDYYTISSNVSQSEKDEILKLLNNYDQIVLACSNINSKDEELNSIINNIKSKNVNLIIALDSPYDYLRYESENVNNYLCVYGYQEASVIALSKYLNSEFKAIGVSPINEKIFN